MPKSQYYWIPKKINYELEGGKKAAKSQSIRFSDYHPLKPIMVTESSGVRGSKRRPSDASSTKSSSSGHASDVTDFIDPLSAFGGTDPLSALSTPVVKTDPSPQKEVSNPEYGEDFQHWSSRKLKILAKYTMDEKLTNEMIAFAKSGGKETARSTHSNKSIQNRLRSRLSQLDDLAEGSIKEMKTQHQQDFINKIKEYSNNLSQAWKSNQKVNALKISIQCAKMLSDSSMMSYYPSRFVLIAEILDTFGNFVFNRILSMCDGMTATNIDPEKVPENAREICLNWMLKIASIRELLPRIYIEACILRCYNFLKKDECNAVLVRLTNMTRGVGNPLVAIYTRTYLCMVSVRHVPWFRGHLVTNFYDFLITYRQIHTTAVQNEITHQRIDMSSYLSLYSPALEWILSCIANKAHDNTLKDVVDRCVKAGSSLLLLQCVFASFKSSYVSSHAMDLCCIIANSQDNLFSKATVYRTLGASVCESDPPEKDRLPLLNDVWKFIIKIQDPGEYIECAEVWSEYAVKNFKKREVNTVLGDVIKHMVPDRAFEKYYGKLHSIMQKMLTHMKDFSVVFSMDKFLPFLDMFQKEDVKVEVCKCIGGFFISNNDSTTSDPLVINGLMYICKAMHDSINSMSLEGEKKSISDVISGIIRKVTFGRDFEQQLSFYVECRASFRNSDLVLATLVHLVNALSVKASRIVKRNHTTKTAAFVRACSAYCFITIPSLNDAYLQLLLYLESGQASLISHCITQADAVFAAAISQILEMKTNVQSQDGKNVPSRNMLLSFISNFLSTLLVVPDHPEQGVLYLLRGLLNVVAGVGDKSSPQTADFCITVYIKVLSLLTAYSQEQYLYKVDDVDSNEDLYSRDEKFLAEISSIGTTLLDEVLSYISSQSAKQDHVKTSATALELFSTIISHGNMGEQSMQKLASNMWSISLHNSKGNTKLMRKMVNSMQHKGGIYGKLASNLAVPS